MPKFYRVSLSDAERLLLHQTLKEGKTSPGCKGCLGRLQPFDALTSISSHELAEAITDPVPGTGWYDDANGEIGDICAWQTETVEGYTVQKLWSNTQGSCR
jgi:hypothetical protein